MTTTVGAGLPHPFAAILALALVTGLASAAGNVGAIVLDGGILQLRGDAAANDVVIAPGAADGELVVTGMNATTVNRAPEPGTFTGVRSLKVDLRNGDDALALEDAVVPVKVEIDLADGDDYLAWTGGRAGHLSAHGRSGDDQIELSSLTVTGELRVDSGDENDHVALDAVTAEALAHVDGRNGDDVVSLVDVTSTGPHFSVFVDEGHDEVSIDGSSFSGFLNVHLGRANDEVVMRAATGWYALLEGGGGFDVYRDAGGNAFENQLQLSQIERRE